ncbi:MAG: preprotein translocase subunit SecG, partial [Bacteroidia bacterium]
LASSFSSSNQVMGVRKTADFLEKATWTLAASLLVLCVISTSYNGKSEGPTTGTTSTTRGMTGSTQSAPPPASNNKPTTTMPAPATTPAPAPNKK